MSRHRLMLLTGTIGLILSCLFIGFVLNAIGQVTGKFSYVFPKEMVDWIGKLVGASVFFLTLGGIGEARAKKKAKEIESSQDEE